jgi:hypothetical protein
VNGDKRTDYCRVAGGQNQISSYVICTLAAGSPSAPAWGENHASPVLNWGYLDARAWVDVNGDGKTDYCRRVSSVNLRSSFVACRLAGDAPGQFGGDVFSPVLDWGHDGTREWIDVDLDGRVDFCRIAGSARELIACRLSRNTPFDMEYIDLVDPPPHR